VFFKIILTSLFLLEALVWWDTGIGELTSYCRVSSLSALTLLVHLSDLTHKNLLLYDQYIVFGGTLNST